MKESRSQDAPLILIVDDDVSMRMFTSAALQKVGCDVAEAENGRMALERFEELRPAAVLLDVGMPEMDGFEVCAALRSLPGGEHVPVLMITGRDDIETIHRSFGAGANDFITKPLNGVRLGYRVRYMLRANQAFLDLQRSQALLAEAQYLAKLGSWELNLETEMFCGSGEFFRISGMGDSSLEASLDRFMATVHPADRRELRGAWEGATQNDCSYALDYRVLLPNGEERSIHQGGRPFWDPVGQQRRIRGFIQDVTELRMAEEQVRFLAYYDGLTGLPNRELFKDRLYKALAAGARKGNSMALLFLDLDQFKRINDTLGHHIGDLLLKVVAERIRECVREADAVARYGEDEETSCVSRLGGDEFTVLLTGLEHPQDAAVVARRILEAIPRPATLQGHEVVVTTSIGISVFPFDGEDIDTLVKNADAAMYEAKGRGRNNFQFYKESLNKVTAERMALENELRKALERDEFVLHYQPQVDIQSGRIIGAEALLRWNNPARGMVMPGDFIPLAEDSGLISPLTEWVIRTACQQNRDWQTAGLEPLPVSVNISGQQFGQQKIAEAVRQALAVTGLAPGCLSVELTESTLMENKEVVRGLLEELKALGLAIAIDDFGTGYSSLSYLKAFPIDILKIDRSFVRDISTDLNDAAIIRAIVAMAQSLELKVVAEGVETETQLDFLRELGCDCVQGFLYSRPVPAGEFFDLAHRCGLASVV